MAKKKKESQVQDIIAILLEQGKKEGVISAKQISEALSEQMEVTAEQLDSMYAVFNNLNIEVIPDDHDVEGELPINDGELIDHDLEVEVDVDVEHLTSDIDRTREDDEEEKEINLFLKVSILVILCVCT